MPPVRSPRPAFRIRVVPALWNPPGEAGGTKIRQRAQLRSRLYHQRPLRIDRRDARCFDPLGEEMILR